MTGAKRKKIELLNEQGFESRYFITEPVPDGHAYYDVRDRNGPYPNFSLVSIWKDTPVALEIAQDVLRRLQEGEHGD